MDYNKLEELRNQKNLTKIKLATAIGRTSQWYYNILIKKNITVEDLERISEYLGVSPIAFYRNDGKISLEDTQENINNKEMNILLKKLVQKQEDEIKYLKNIIKRLEHQIGIFNGDKNI